MIEKIKKYPMVEDFRKRLLYSDEVEFFNVIDSIKELRDDAAHLLDLLEKNTEKLTNPSGIAKRLHSSIF